MQLFLLYFIHFLNLLLIFFLFRLIQRTIVVFFFEELLDDFGHRMSVRVSAGVLLNQIILFILDGTEDRVNVSD